MLACISPALHKLFLERQKHSISLEGKEVYIICHYTRSQRVRTVALKGTVTEVTAMIRLWGTLEALHSLLDHGAGRTNPTPILMSHLTRHALTDTYFAKRQHRSDKEWCPITRLIGYGANLAGTGYKVTPLQLAASNVDVKLANTLLQAGADPEGIGDPDGVCWEECPELVRLCEFSALPPVEVAFRNQDRARRRWRGRKFEEKLQEFLQLMKRYGATVPVGLNQESAEKTPSIEQEGELVAESKI